MSEARAPGAWVQAADGKRLHGARVQRLVDDWFQLDACHWADLYHDTSVSSLIYQERQDRTLSWVDNLGMTAGAPALELGCGAGILAVELARRGLRVSATDPAPAMLRLARRHAVDANVDVRVAQVDAQHLGVANAAFELVIALGVVPWLHSPRAALCETARVLRTGGYLIASADNRARLTHVIDPRYNPLLGGMRWLGRRLLGAAPRSGIRPKLHWVCEFDALLDSAGLDKVSAATIGFGPFTWLGHDLLPDALGWRLHRRLQRVADDAAPGLRWSGSHYLVLARKRA
ncbi:MAG: methyltransferase domain-containing protein [Chloroflexi bacterium]|nr:methyltransferase domain-containing protein [Chloroflexota bacterium]